LIIDIILTLNWVIDVILKTKLTLNLKLNKRCKQFKRRLIISRLCHLNKVSWIMLHQLKLYFLKS
jgi:hypothetical protein